MGWIDKKISYERTSENWTCHNLDSNPELLLDFDGISFGLFQSIVTDVFGMRPIIQVNLFLIFSILVKWVVFEINDQESLYRHMSSRAWSRIVSSILQARAFLENARIMLVVALSQWTKDKLRLLQFNCNDLFIKWKKKKMGGGRSQITWALFFRVFQ